jgi:hypothetical protein
MKLHQKIFKEIKNKEIFKTIKKHLEEIYKAYKENPDYILEIYEKVISENFLRKCEDLEELYLFLIFKLSLSESAEDLNIFEYQAKRVEELFNNLNLKAYGSFPEILIPNEREKFPLNKALEEELWRYDELERLSKLDENLEDVLEKKLLLYVIAHPFRIKRFIKEIESKSLKEILSS